LYEKSREKLRELIREDTRAKLGEAASEDDVNKAVETAINDVPAEKLPDKIRAVLRQRLGDLLPQLLKDTPDEQLRGKLAEVVRDGSYDGACEKLRPILPELPEGEVRGRIQAALSEEIPDDRLKVTYILATDPSTSYEGTVKEIHRSAEVRGDEGNTVLIKVAINKEELSDRRPGATVTAKVYCGYRSLGFVLLHDVAAFIQSRILFRYF
jgi:hypothetical protein